MLAQLAINKPAPARRIIAIADSVATSELRSALCHRTRVRKAVTASCVLPNSADRPLTDVASEANLS